MNNNENDPIELVEGQSRNIVLLPSNYKLVLSYKCTDISSPGQSGKITKINSKGQPLKRIIDELISILSKSNKMRNPQVRTHIFENFSLDQKNLLQEKRSNEVDDTEADLQIIFDFAVELKELAKAIKNTIKIVESSLREKISNVLEEYELVEKQKYKSENFVKSILLKNMKKDFELHGKNLDLITEKLKYLQSEYIIQTGSDKFKLKTQIKQTKEERHEIKQTMETIRQEIKKTEQGGESIGQNIIKPANNEV